MNPASFDSRQDAHDKAQPYESSFTASPGPVMKLELLGLMRLHHGGDVVRLPASRKVRGLLAYLALTSRASTRDHLCGLLWDSPTDPRGELRWALSKLRRVVDEPDRPRVQADNKTVRLDLAELQVDALEVLHAVQSGLDSCSVERLRALAAHFRGNFLEGLSIERSAPFSAWLLAQRRSLRAARIAILERLTQTLPAGSDEAMAYLETWLQLEPLERHAHEMLLAALAQRKRLHEGDEHLAAVVRLFEAEGLDWRPLGKLWHDLRAQLPGRSTPHAHEPPHDTDKMRATDAQTLSHFYGDDQDIAGLLLALHRIPDQQRRDRIHNLPVQL